MGASMIRRLLRFWLNRAAIEYVRIVPTRPHWTATIEAER